MSKEKLGIQWVSINGFPNYEVSNYGQIRNKTTGLFLYGTPYDKCGHLQVPLRNNGVATIFRYHQVVLEAFVGKRPTGYVCRHLDGNPKNNRLDNICWGTQSENSFDSIKHGRWPDNRGEKCGTSKLTEQQVSLIRLLWGETKLTMREIAERFKVTQPTVSMIINGHTWKQT